MHLKEHKAQGELPFGEAEGSFAERLELLGLALLKVNASIYEAQFMRWLFNTTDGGLRGHLEKSYAELAARPWGLCCHPNQAAATVRKCRERNWIAAASTSVRRGIQGPNRYTLHWPGVKATFSVTLQPHTPCVALHTTCDPPHTECDPPHTTCEGIGITPLTSTLTTQRRRDVRGGDVRRDGARELDQDQVEAIRQKANTIDIWIAANKPEDRELVLKIATLWELGEIPEDCMQQVLESFQRKRASRESLARPCGWLWATLRGQMAKHGVKLESLLATTPFPQALLQPPSKRQPH